MLVIFPAASFGVGPTGKVVLTVFGMLASLYCSKQLEISFTF